MICEPLCNKQFFQFSTTLFRVRKSNNFHLTLCNKHSFILLHYNKLIYSYSGAKKTGPLLLFDTRLHVYRL